MYGRRILVLAPHPDDEIVGCGIAMRRALSQGAAVRVAFLSDGIPAAHLLWPWQRPARGRRCVRRRREAEACARLLGHAIALWNDIPTRTVREHLLELASLLRRLVAEIKPDAIWVPAYEGGHQDHDAAHFLAGRLGATGSVWEFAEYNRAGGRVRSHAFPRLRGDEVAVTLSPEERRLKRDLLNIYGSERANLRHLDLARECFRPFVAADYARPAHVGKLFYQRFQWVPWHPRVDRTQPVKVCQALMRAAAVLDGEPGQVAGGVA